jgi:hypothetical protein
LSEKGIHGTQPTLTTSVSMLFQPNSLTRIPFVHAPQRLRSAALFSLPPSACTMPPLKPHTHTHPCCRRLNAFLSARSHPIVSAISVCATTARRSPLAMPRLALTTSIHTPSLRHAIRRRTPTSATGHDVSNHSFPLPFLILTCALCH